LFKEDRKNFKMDEDFDLLNKEFKALAAKFKCAIEKIDK
jgi:hypothetical protein